jgi:hypothetical protein
MPKIKIVDVVDKDVKSDAYAATVDEIEENVLPDKNEQFEAAEEAPSIAQEKYEGATEEVSIDTVAAELRGVKNAPDGIDGVDPSPTKKIRNQELIQCEKCNKWVTPKTMKYTHHLKCGIVKNSRGGRPKKSQIKINEITQEDTPPSPVLPETVAKVKKPTEPRQQPPKTIVKEVLKSFEELRKERLIQRLKQREERNVSLFKQVF